MLAVHLVITYCLHSLLCSCEIWRLSNTGAKPGTIMCLKILMDNGAKV